MTKAEVVDAVVRATGLAPKHAEVIVEATLRSVVDSMRRGEKVELRGFGSFRLRKRPPRRSRNPKTGASVEVPSKLVAYFKPGKDLKDALDATPGPSLVS